MAVRRKVTRAEFEQLECNRCGACCEKLWLPGPLKLVEFLSAADAMPDASEGWLEENGRFIRWLSALEPTGKVNERAGSGDEVIYQYRCSRFVRDEQGAGFCTAYEDRPSACRGFPYGQPVHAVDFEECSWNVEIVSDVSQRVGRLAGSLLSRFGGRTAAE